MRAETSSEPIRRVIVLGASNVALGLSSLIGICRSSWGAPLDLHIAAGHGRGLHHPSQVLGRYLPSILDSDLWSRLEHLPPLPTAALLTDLGNDLVYGSSAQQVLQWTAECIQRLTPYTERLVVTRLPLESISRLSPARFRRLRRLLFPSSQLEFSTALESVTQINRELGGFAKRFGCYVMAPSPDWYGKDPIHVQNSCRATAWNRYLAPWRDFSMVSQSLRTSRLASMRWAAKLRPQGMKWMGIDIGKRQPCFESADGSRFWAH